MCFRRLSFTPRTGATAKIRMNHRTEITVVTEECSGWPAMADLGSAFGFSQPGGARVNAKSGWHQPPAPNQSPAPSDFVVRVWRLRVHRVLRASLSSLTIHRIEPTWTGLIKAGFGSPVVRGPGYKASLIRFSALRNSAYLCVRMFFHSVMKTIKSPRWKIRKAVGFRQ